MNNIFSKTLFARLACLVLTLLTVLHVDAQLFIQKPGLVQVTNSGTPIAVSFTNELSVATSTNVALASVTAASPLPVYLTTNGVNVTNQISVSTNVSLANVTAASPLPVYAVTNYVNVTNDVNLSSTNSIHVTIDGGTNTLEVAASLPVHTLPGTNLTALVGNTAATPVPVFMPTNNVNVTNVTTVVGKTITYQTALECNTAGAYAAGDQWATRVAAPLLRTSGGTAMLNSLTLLSADDSAPAVTVIFFKASYTTNALNSPVNFTPADLTNVLFGVPITASDYTDIGTNRIATKLVNLSMSALTGTDVYLGFVAGDTQQITNAPVLSLGALQD